VASPPHASSLKLSVSLHLYRFLSNLSRLGRKEKKSKKEERKGRGERKRKRRNLDPKTTPCKKKIIIIIIIILVILDIAQQSKTNLVMSVSVTAQQNKTE